MAKDRSFSAKVILAGEYSVLQTHRAVVMPLQSYSARWVRALEHKLEPLWHSLKDRFSAFEALKFLDFKTMSDDISRGWYVASDIPIGYGLGSSGALCAAILHRYGQNVSSQSEELLRHHLAKIESYFHGTSSGVDPLVSYLDQAISLSEGQISVLSDWDPPQLYLWDSGIDRVGLEQVERYHERMRDRAFAQKWQLQYIPAVERLIQKLEQIQDLSSEWLGVSQLQWELMQDWIPEEVRTIWREGYDSGKYSLKLCGAGGGGFFLVHTEDPADSGLSLLPVYQAPS